MNKEHYILQQLVKIAEQQQKVLEKLAQIPQPDIIHDPIIEYLMRAIPVTAANVGINNVVVISVDKEGDTYLATVQGIPTKLMDTFKQTWERQLNTQKPDLVGRVNLSFAN